MYCRQQFRLPHQFHVLPPTVQVIYCSIHVLPPTVQVIYCSSLLSLYCIWSTEMSTIRAPCLLLLLLVKPKVSYLNKLNFFLFSDIFPAVTSGQIIKTGNLYFFIQNSKCSLRHFLVPPPPVLREKANVVVFITVAPLCESVAQNTVQ